VTQALTVVIPHRDGESTKITLNSLARQAFRDFSTLEVCDRNRGANWARNAGFEQVSTPLVLFSDSDINWDRDGLQTLVDTLAANPGAAYAYGGYEMGGRTFCDRAWDAGLLRKTNYISTMSLVRASAFREVGGFDESLQRLQDWDLWLSLVARGYYGAYCGRRIFTTAIRPGISFGNGMSWQEAERIVKKKHGLR
jgi:glycosyltransferase involved in cell wall biosynthesis